MKGLFKIFNDVARKNEIDALAYAVYSIKCKRI